MENSGLYLAQYEAIYKAVDAHLDIRGSALSALVRICIGNHGKLTTAVRDKFKHCVPDSYFDYIEEVAKDVLHSSS